MVNTEGAVINIQQSADFADGPPSDANPKMQTGSGTLTLPDGTQFVITVNFLVGSNGPVSGAMTPIGSDGTPAQ